MAKVHDALKQIERERQQVRVAPITPRPAGQVSRSSWKRWFIRKPRPAQQASSVERLERVAARLDLFEKQLSAPGPSPSDPVLLERTEMIARKLDSLEERLSQSIPNTELLLHTMGMQLATLEQPLIARIGEATNRLSERTALLNTRITVLLVVIALTLLGILFRR